MLATHTEASFESHLKGEMTTLAPLLLSLGFILDKEQPHTSGERFLMTRNKLVLMGTLRDTGEKIVIKASHHEDGRKEIRYEKQVRDLLSSLSFANDALLFPKEIYFGQSEKYLFLITEYIPQDKVFVEHSLEEQFFMTLRAFNAQEAFHATTFEHLKKIGKILPVVYAQDYFKFFAEFQIKEYKKEAEQFLREHKALIDKYSNYLIHEDFVPHNFRVNGKKMYMLDTASVWFGNKYEGWARFLNYMIIHNPNLEKILVEYLRTNRGQEEYLDLRLMRVYKIGKLINYYNLSLPKTEGDLHELTKKRITFWQEIMGLVLEDKPVPDAIVNAYKNNRNTLRSQEEKERQKEFAVA
jgi:hypothetical protein